MARPGLMRHPKFRRFVKLLREPVPHCRGYLELLWEVGYESGDALIGDAADVEMAAEYPARRPKGKLLEALLNCGGPGHFGFIEPTKSDTQLTQYVIHDLLDHAPDYVLKRKLRERDRKHKGLQQNCPVSDQSVTGQCPPNGASNTTHPNTTHPTPPQPRNGQPPWTTDQLDAVTREAITGGRVGVEKDSLQGGSGEEREGGNGGGNLITKKTQFLQDLRDAEALGKAMPDGAAAEKSEILSGLQFRSNVCRRQLIDRHDIPAEWLRAQRADIERTEKDPSAIAGAILHRVKERDRERDRKRAAGNGAAVRQA
ncbi:MAG TPA: hypothetical protein VH518_21030 [Tepidisphaeraceae bacterium]